MNKNSSLIKKSPYFGGMAFMAMIALYVLISYIGQAICMAIFPDGGAVYIAICSTFSVLAMLFVTCFFALKTDLSPNEITGLKKFNPIYLLFAMMLSLGMFFGLGFVNSAFIELLSKFGVTVGSAQIPLDNLGQYVGFSIILALLPALLEEIFFRGLILGSLKKVKTVYAVIAVSLCFALYHSSATQLIYQFIYGVGFCLLYLASDSVIPCIMAHFVNNFAILTIEFTGAIVDLANPWLIVCGILVLVAFFFFTVRSVCNKNNNKEKTDSVKSFYFPFGICGLLICAVLIIGGLFLGA